MLSVISLQLTISGINIQLTLKRYKPTADIKCYQGWGQLQTSITIIITTS